MLLLCKFRKYQPHLKHVISHFVQVLHVRISEIKVLRIGMYSGIHINKSLLGNLNICEETVSKKQCYSVVIALEKPWGFRRHTIMSTLFISVFLMRIKFVITVFFSVFHHLRQLLLRSLVIKGKNVLSSKIEFRKSYWISNKNNNLICVIGCFFYYSI